MRGSLHPDRDDDKDQTAGFVVEYVHVYRGGEIRDLKMLLPANTETAQYLKELKKKALKDREKAFEVREQEEEARNLARIAAKEAKQIELSKTLPGSNYKKNDSLDILAERQSLSDKYIDDQALEDAGLVPVYAWDEPLKLIEHIKSATPDKETVLRNTELFKRLKAKGNLRRIAKPDDQNDALSKLEALRASQPHFGEVIDLMRQQMVLSAARNQPLQLPAILLFGEPGVGKTHFTQALAAVLETTVRRQSFDSPTTDSALMGSDKHWANTTYGLIFDLICLGDCANPVVLLDEIDKSNTSSTYGYRDPLAPLHTLLESITSSKVRDSSVGLEFDASRILYVATANDPARVSSSLRSRFVEFHIQPPAGAQALHVAQAVASAVHAEMALPDFGQVQPQIVKLVAHLSAREQGQVLRRAFAAAVSNGRTSLERLDLPPDVLLEDQKTSDDVNDDDAERPTFFH